MVSADARKMFDAFAKPGACIALEPEPEEAEAAALTRKGRLVWRKSTRSGERVEDRSQQADVFEVPCQRAVAQAKTDARDRCSQTYQQ